MGVSYSEGAGSNLDLDALVQGGDAFMKRVQQLKAAKDAHDKAFDALNLGKSAAVAYNDAQLNVANSLKHAEEIKAEADRVVAEAQKSAAMIVPAANDDAAKIIASARDEAAAILATAHASANDLNRDVASGRQALMAWSDKTTAEASSIMQSAVATKADADRQLAENKAKAKELTDAQAKAAAAAATAQALQDKLTAKLDIINKTAAG